MVTAHGCCYWSFSIAPILFIFQSKEVMAFGGFTPSPFILHRLSTHECMYEHQHYSYVKNVNNRRISYIIHCIFPGSKGIYWWTSCAYLIINRPVINTASVTSGQCYAIHSIWITVIAVKRVELRGIIISDPKTLRHNVRLQWMHGNISMYCTILDCSLLDMLGVWWLMYDAESWYECEDIVLDCL
jgi:hypothetical protein